MNLRFISKILRPFRRSQDELLVYSDGSHKGKWGSWAFVVVQGNQVLHEASGRVRRTNSHRMEFQAAIEALQYLGSGKRVFFFTDSRVLIQSATQNKGASRANADQIKKLRKLSAEHSVSWKWVKAHSGIVYNERCDRLCNEARKQSVTF